ncbi:MAG TPA: alpha/beta fold hydrolase [Chthonomonadales bacterium]|nr:alpha/beta fold hydrolase [Chthonomonadales bacterium]
MQQEIRFCSSPDGVRIAYAKIGNGPPIVRVGTFLTHLEYDWHSPIWRPWLDNLSRFHTLYRYDARGCGLSDWDVEDFSLDALLCDIETVVDAAGLERFALFGMSQGGGAAVKYATQHQERVTHVIVLGGYLQGSYHAACDTDSYEEYKVRQGLFKLAWAKDYPPHHQVFTTELIPDGTSEQIKWLTDLQRISTTGENAARLSEGYSYIDVTEEAAKLAVPTLILHARGDMKVRFERGRKLATTIPGARFVPLDSKNHILLPSESAWQQFWHHFYAFLGIPETRYQDNLRHESAASTLSRFAELTLREREVLHLLAKGYHNDEIAQSLVLSPKTVRNYVSRIFDKLDVASRGEAIVLAKESGFGNDTA